MVQYSKELFHNIICSTVSKRYCFAVLLAFMAILLLFPSEARCQVTDDFSDGDLGSNPAWNGDTSHFRINSRKQLQLYTSGAGRSQISFAYTLPQSDTVTWDFWMKTGFTPTMNNYAVIVLYADSAEIQSSSHFLALDVISTLYGARNIILYNESDPLFIFPYCPEASTNPLRFKIMLIDGSDMEMWIDTVGDTDTAQFIYAGSALLTAPPQSSEMHFALICQYTSSRSQAFYFDDIGINRDAISITDSGGNDGNDGSDSTRLLPGQILVNEVLFNPEPGGADYVELYNNSDSAIALGRLRLARVSGETVTRLYPVADSGTIEPHDYVVLTTDAAYVASHYTVRHPGKMVEMSSMPAYNDDKGCVMVTDADTTVLDRFDYSEKMHSRLLNDKEGVALERRSAEAATNDGNNWYSAASTAGFGTPTYANSQSHEFLFTDNDISIAQPLFSPDGDGYNDLLDITYSLQDCSLSGNVTIHDAAGRIRRHLARGALLGCQGVLTWDGTDDNGHLCQRGNYIVVIEAYNTNGASQSWRRKVTLVVR